MNLASNAFREARVLCGPMNATRGGCHDRTNERRRDLMMNRCDASGGDVISDDFGMMYLRREALGHIDLNVDGSARFSFRGGLPIVLGVTDSAGALLSFDEGDPFTGERIQREQMQFYPGERSHQSFRRELFNGMCAGCHGSISGRELDVAVDVDVLTTASRAMSTGQGPAGL